MRQAELGVLEERLAAHADGELVDEDVIRSLHGLLGPAELLMRASCRRPCDGLSRGGVNSRATTQKLSCSAYQSVSHYHTPTNNKQKLLPPYYYFSRFSTLGGIARLGTTTTLSEVARPWSGMHTVPCTSHMYILQSYQCTHKRERPAQTLDFPSTGHIREREPLFVHLVRLRGRDRHFAWPGTTGHEPAHVV